MRRKDKNCERGMITVEAVLSLVPFIIAMLGIISFINVFMVHNKIQFAITQAASELSAYTYFYEALGIRNADKQLGEDIESGTVEINKTIEKTTDFLGELENLRGSISEVENTSIQNVDELYNNLEGTVEQGKQTVESGKEMLEAGKDLVHNPKTFLRNIVYKGIDFAEGELKTVLLGALSDGLVDTYLESTFSSVNPMTAEEYLTIAGVVDGLDFSESTMFMRDESGESAIGGYRMIDIVVEYDLKIYILDLFLKDSTIHVVQRCAVPAWLDGDGVSYMKGN